jgi:hypothetical protein
MLNVIMLSVAMLSVVMLSVVMLSVVMLSVVMLSVVMLSVVMLSVVMLSVVMLSLVMLSVVMLSVIKLIVVTPGSLACPVYKVGQKLFYQGNTPAYLSLLSVMMKKYFLNIYSRCQFHKHFMSVIYIAVSK